MKNTILFSICLSFVCPGFMTSASFVCTPMDQIAPGWKAREVWVHDARCVFMIADNINSSRIYAFDGTSWIDISGPITGSLYDIDGTAPDNVYAIGKPEDSATGIVYQWNGSAWNSITGIMDGIARMMHVSDNGEIAIGNSDGMVVTFDGNAWHQLQNAGLSSLKDIWFDSLNEIYVVGGDLEFDPVTWYIEHTRVIGRWDGSQWNTIITDAPMLNAICGFSSGELFMCSESEVFSMDAAMNLTPLPSCYRADDYVTFRELVGFSPHDIYAVGDKGGGQDHPLVCYYDGHVVREIENGCSAVADMFFHAGGGNDRTLCCTGPDVVAISDGSGNCLDGTVLCHPVFIRSNGVFYLYAYLENCGQAIENARFYCVLDVHGEYWFWDDWSHYSNGDPNTIDYAAVDLPAGTTFVEIIPQFYWPEHCIGVYYNLFFHGVILDPESNQMIGRMTSSEWGFDCN